MKLLGDLKDKVKKADPYYVIQLDHCRPVPDQISYNKN